MVGSYRRYVGPRFGRGNWFGPRGRSGRRIIYKNTSVTGRRKRPVMFFLKGTTLLSSWIGVGIFWARSDDE